MSVAWRPPSRMRAQQVEHFILDDDVQGGGGLVATIKDGSQARAMAITARWRMPPLNSVRVAPCPRRVEVDLLGTNASARRCALGVAGCPMLADGFHDLRADAGHRVERNSWHSA